MVSIPVCHTGDRDSVPHQGGFLNFFIVHILIMAGNSCTVLVHVQCFKFNVVKSFSRFHMTVLLICRTSYIKTLAGIVSSVCAFDFVTL